MTTETRELLRIGELAEMAGITVRTLHHYDELGLLTPDERSPAGYRLYGQAAVERLQEVLFFRELGFALEEIKRIVQQPTYDRIAALARQRAMLDERLARLHQLIGAVQAAIDAHERGATMTHEAMLGVFGDFDPADHQEEARERWGDTTAYAQSAKRTSGYSREDWQAIKAEMDQIYAAFVVLMQDGAAPDSAEAIALAERHRAHISRWYYDCTKAIHAGLGQMYVQDPRFTANIDEAGEGLAAYMAAAIAAAAVEA